VREEVHEARLEAAPAVVAVIVLQLTLAAVSDSQHWQLWHLGWWVWLVALPPELVLLGVLLISRRRHPLEEQGVRRTVTLTLLALVGVANAFVLVAVLGSLISGDEQSGAQLLLKAMTVWATNVVVFGLVYWVLDGGGPVRRLERDPQPADFQFPQMDSDQPSTRGWRPHLVDYVYVSYTNSIAFSPTDAMPLTRRAKLAMLSESALSALTILLVTARAVNIFKGGGG